MAPLATGAGSGEVAAGTAAKGGTAILARLTIPGRAEYVGAARSFVAGALGGGPGADVAVLLVSETVTNAVLHSNSRHPGGKVTISVFGMDGGVRIDVADDGSDRSTPVVKGDGCVTGGHGLFLVQTLADQWGYVRDETGTTVWFWIPEKSRLPAAGAA
jgi:anti-sigma regulatory factor (Ser/Thr protein kinase)